MAQFQNKELQGYLFKNEPKDGAELSPNAPVLKGTCLVNGKEMEIALWRSDDDRAHSFGFKISPPFVKEETSETSTETPSNEVPF